MTNIYCVVNKHLFKIKFKKTSDNHYNQLLYNQALIGLLIIHFHFICFTFWYYKITIIKYQIIKKSNFVKSLHFSCVWSKKSHKVLSKTNFCSIWNWITQSVKSVLLKIAEAVDQFNIIGYYKRIMVQLMRVEYIIFHIKKYFARYCFE